MSNFIDLTGQVFGDLTVIERVYPVQKWHIVWWSCVCSCGNKRNVRSQDIRTRRTRSCGKHSRRNPDAASYQPEYAIWRGLINRCENPNVHAFRHYGGRGIKVGKSWRYSYANFLADMGSRPSPKHSVERINNNGNYEPGNCKWATPQEQGNNRRNTRRVFYRGVNMTLAHAVRLAGSVIHIEAAWIRLQWGWPSEKALETPRIRRSGAAKDGVNDHRAMYGLAGPPEPKIKPSTEAR